MLKKLCLAAALLVALPAGAHTTKPTDLVGVETATYNEFGDKMTDHAIYVKPWSQIKINAKTVRDIDVKVGVIKSRQSLQDNGFKIVHLNIIDEDLRGVLLVSEIGTVIALDYSNPHAYCVTVLSSQMPVNSTCEAF